MRVALRKFIYGASGEAPDNAFLATKKKGDTLLTGMIDPDAMPDWLSAADLDFYEGEFTRTGFRAPLNWYRNLDRTWHRTPELAEAKVTQPSLFVTGERDPVLRFMPGWRPILEKLTTDLRGVVMLEGCGHWTQQERPDAVNAALIDFLRGL